MNWSAVKGHCSGRRHVWLLLGMLSAAIPLGAGTALIYVTNRGGTTIDVIDAATNKVVHTIGNIESPEVVRFSSDGRQLYIFSRAEPEENFLIVMDRKSEKIVKKVPLSGWANEAQTTNDGKLILVCIRNTGTKAEDVGALDIIDTTTLEKVKSIPVRKGLHDLAVTGDGKYVAAGAPGGRFLVVFDLQKMEAAWEVQYDSSVNPIAIENNPDGSGRRIFVNLGPLNSFSVVDFAKRAEVARIKAPDEPTGFGVGRGAKATPTASVSRRTRRLSGSTAGRLILFSPIRFLISKCWDMSRCRNKSCRESQAGQEIRPGSLSLLTARPFTFPVVG